LTFVFHFLSDTQSDPDFSIVARVEAFIAGWGLDEALKRSEAYLNAGADAILMHSKKSDPSDIEAFVKAWNNQVRVMIYMHFSFSSAPALLAARAHPSHIATLGKERDCSQSNAGLLSLRFEEGIFLLE